MTIVTTYIGNNSEDLFTSEPEILYEINMNKTFPGNRLRYVSVCVLAREAMIGDSNPI